MRKYFYKLIIYPAKFYWFIFRPSSYGVKCIIYRSDNELLLIRNTYGKGWWNLPGGGIKRNETPEQAVRREVLEEVGIDIRNIENIGTFLNTLEYKKDNVSVFASQVDGDMVLIDPGEIEEAKWFNIDNLPNPMSTVAKKSLSLWLKKDIK